MFRDAIDNNCKFPNEINPLFGHSVLDRVNFWQSTEPTIVDRLLGGCLHSESYLAAHWPKVTQISLKLKLLTFWHLLEISLSSSFTAIWVTLDELRACLFVSARAHVCVANFWLTFKQWCFLYETRARWLNGKENIKQNSTTFVLELSNKVARTHTVLDVLSPNSSVK